MVNKIALSKDLSISRIIHGHWRLADWGLTKEALLFLTEQTVELGVNTFDHADIYGNYTCEKLFGDALALKEGFRNEIRIITKCGIKLASDRFPGRKLKIYDYSFDHILASVEQSLQNFRTDRIDLLLLHRPSPFFNPDEVARAFSALKSSGKVLHFGVSNFTPGQFEMLSACTEEPLVANQVEISPYCIEHFENGNIDFLTRKRIPPLAWSPLAGGRLFNPQDEKGQRILRALKEVAEEVKTDAIDSLIYCWLLKHPASIIPIAGSSRIERIRHAAAALDMEISLEHWFKIYNAATGTSLP